MITSGIDRPTSSTTNGSVSTRIAHHFTVDLEEHFQVSAFDNLVPRADWEQHSSRVARNTRLILELLAESGAQATIFVLGWIAERQPDLVREIAASGHEIASHGWDHRRVTEQTPEEFRASVRRTRQYLEDLTGQPVLGFRAPSFSIVAGFEWALDVLVEEGYSYDSSLYPVRRPGYGYRRGVRELHRLDRPSGTLVQVPPATLRWARMNLPAGGGAYLRHFPYRLVGRALEQFERQGTPGTFYIHPWEVDPEQPRLPARLLTRMRHYGGLHRTEPRLRRLLKEFRFQSIARTLQQHTWS